MDKKEIVQKAFNEALKVLLDNTKTVEEATALRIDLSIMLDTREPVPVSDKIAEAFKAIRHNFWAKEKLDNLIRTFKATHGDDPKTTWGGLLIELAEIKDLLAQADIRDQKFMNAVEIFQACDGLGCDCSTCPIGNELSVELGDLDISLKFSTCAIFLLIRKALDGDGKDGDYVYVADHENSAITILDANQE